MVVHHVQENHDAQPVSSVYQLMQFARGAEAGLGGEGEYAVIAPVVLARVLTDRHQLYCRYPQLPQLAEALADAPEATQDSRMQLVDDGLVPWPAAPVLILPGEGLKVDYTAGAVNPLGLIARCRVRYRQPVVYQETVLGARAAADPGAVPSLILVVQAVDAAVPEPHHYAVCIGRP